MITLLTDLKINLLFKNKKYIYKYLEGEGDHLRHNHFEHLRTHKHF